MNIFETFIFQPINSISLLNIIWYFEFMVYVYIINLKNWPTDINSVRI